ncbi:MAG TPA: shikimate kinase [Actinomycetota bacterium]|nr:shikimate kinase [Actinomycetota bacterium]
MTTPSAPIALVGLPGVGKTTVGQALARRLGMPFHDTDDLVAVAMGYPSVGAAFESKGEAVVRSYELEILEALVLRPAARPGVIAVGPAAPTIDGVPDLLRSGSTCIWLLATVTTVAERLLYVGWHQGAFPIDWRPALERTLAANGGAYDRASAHHIWTTLAGDPTPVGRPEDIEQVAQTVVEALALGGSSCCGAHGPRWHPCSLTVGAVRP